MKNSQRVAARILLMFLLVPTSYIMGQVPLSDAERREYFNDDKISVSRNTLKVDLVSFAQRELAVHLEHRYGQILSLEVAVGYLFRGYHHSVFPALLPVIFAVPEWEREYYNSGFSTFLQQRFYTSTGFNPYYIQFYVKHRKFSTMSSGDFMLGMGKQWLLGERIWVDLNFGMGLRKKWRQANDPYAYRDPEDITTDFPLSLKIGYILK